MAISHIPRSVGHNFTPEYQISAIPFMKTITIGVALEDEGDNIRSFEFPKITQWISFKTSVALSVYFCKEDAQAGLNGIELNNETTFPFRLRCTKLYFLNTALADQGKTLSIRSGLTVIGKEEFSGVVETFLEEVN